MIIQTEHNGGLKGFLERFREIGKPKVYIGVPASKNGMHEGGINMATLLALHALGAPSRGIPQRDPLRPPLIANAQRYSDLLALGLKNALSDGTADHYIAVHLQSVAVLVDHAAGCLVMVRRGRAMLTR